MYNLAAYFFHSSAQNATYVVNTDLLNWVLQLFSYVVTYMLTLTVSKSALPRSNQTVLILHIHTYIHFGRRSQD